MRRLNKIDELLEKMRFDVINNSFDGVRYLFNERDYKKRLINGEIDNFQREVHDLGLFNDREFLIEVIKIEPSLVVGFEDEFKNDKELLMFAVTKDCSIVRYFEEYNVKYDKDIAVKACSKDPSAFSYISEELRNDRELVLKCVSSYYYLFKDIGEELRNDRDFVLEFVSKYGSFLKYASNFQDDDEIVCKAVKSDSSALEFASERLKNDKDFLLKTFKNAS